MTLSSDINSLINKKINFLRLKFKIFIAEKPSYNYYESAFKCNAGNNKLQNLNLLSCLFNQKS